MSTPLAALLFLALATPAGAYLAPVGEETVVAAGGDPERPAVAATPDGGLLVAWSDSASRQVAVRRYDGAGRPLGRTQTLSRRGEAPALAVDGAGGAVVAWRQLAADGSRLLARRLDPDGVPHGALLLLGEPSPALDSGPALALAPDGGFAVAWTENADSFAAGSDVRLRLFAADGLPAGASFVVHDGALGLHRLGGLTRCGDTWVVVWQHQPGPFQATVVEQRAFAADGTPLGDAERLDASNAIQTTPSVAALADGAWAAAWLSFDFTTDRLAVASRRVDPDGAGTPVLEVTPDVEPLFSASTRVTPLADGGWLVTWSSAAPGDGATPRVFGRAFDASGTPAGDPFAVALGDGAGEQPAAAPLAGGGAAVAWRAAPAAGAPGELRLRRLDTPCVGDAATLCLADGRFRARVTYADPFGRGGDGVALPRGERWGSFWFFRPSNVELAVKVLDGRKIDGNFWVFYASLTNVAFTLTVADVETGNRRVYVNPGGTLASRGDTAALPGGSPEDRAAAARVARAGRSGAGGDLPDLRPTLVPLPAASEEAGCRPGPDRLCLGAGGRFAVEATWHDFGHGQGAAGALPQTTDTGALWFFRPGNPELIVKVLDGRAVNGSFWVFYGALTNVAFDLVVRDTASGEEVRYENPLGTFASRGDTGAFPP